MASKTKKRSEFFRVAVEGATTDGRVIERQQIADIAETYDPEVYGARIWLEHFRSTLPDSPFRAYGDVLAVKAAAEALGNTPTVARGSYIDPRVFSRYRRGDLLDTAISPESAIRALLLG